MTINSTDFFTIFVARNNNYDTFPKFMEQSTNSRTDTVIYCAPVQGLTETAWRHYHRDIYGDGITSYFTPFLRVERGEVRYRDARDLKSDLNVGLPLVPQIIFRDLKEFKALCDTVVDAGYSSIDINMGCPFPPQVHHGRGAGAIANVALIESLNDEMNGAYKDVKFSLKMRLGAEAPDEWQASAEAINALPLTHVTLHPRTARQQYEGDLHMDQFARFLESSRHPVIYNGDLTEPVHIDDILTRYPLLGGVMIGRGLFSRPSLVAEWRSGCEWDEVHRMEALRRLHSSVYDYYCDTLSGDVQVLGKLKPFWEYMAPQLDRKAYKGIKKATTLRKYDDAVGMIFR